MDLSDAGAAFIAEQEGAVDHWYLDATGNWTIGIGHLWDGSNEFADVAVEENGVIAGHRRLSEAEMWGLFRTDARRYIDAVNRLVTVPLTQHQFDMAVDFAFNWGIGEVSGFPATSVLRLINEGDFDAVATELVDGRGPATPEFPTGRRYDKGLAGVRNRRKLEASAFAGTAPKEKTMELWHPRARRAPANLTGGSFIGAPWKIVLHTVEGRGRYSYTPGSYYGKPYWPQSTIDIEGIHQHLPINVSAYALANAAGGAETNRANAIQAEILWFADEIGDMPDELLANVADWVSWVAEQTDTPLEFATFRGAGSYGENAPQRFSAQEWLDFTGVCGHQHVPENDHWDPGAFPVARLRALLGPTPAPSKEDQLFSDSPVYTVHIIASHSGLLLTSDAAEHGAGVTQQRANGSLNQRWEVWGHDNGEVSLVNRAGGFALDRPDYSTEAGTLLQVARTEHNAAQRWSLDQLKPFLARLWAPGTNRCLDVRMRSVDAGAGLQLWTGLRDDEDPRHQQFVFAPTV